MTPHEVQMALQLATIEELIDALETRTDALVLAVEHRHPLDGHKDGGTQAVAEYWYRGAYFKGVGLAYALVHWMMEQRRDTTAEELDRWEREQEDL